MKDLFGTQQRPYILTHDDWQDFAVLIWAEDEWQAFESMKVNGIPDDAKFYTNPESDKLNGKTIIGINEYKAMMEEEK